MMSDWWILNGKYVRAYALYLLIMWLCQLTVKHPLIYTSLAKPLIWIGLPPRVALSMVVLAIGFLIVWVGFVAFRAMARRFIEPSE